MRWMIHALSKPPVAAVSMTRPPRNTVTRSETRSTSSKKCEMNTIPRPVARNRPSSWNSVSTSGGDSAEVGSSKIRMRAPDDSTRASSTICCRPSGSEPAGARGSASMPRLRSCAAARRIMPPQSITPSRFTGCLPSATFSATDSSGTMDSSWCTMPIPASMASRAERKRTGASPTRIVPS